MGEPEVSRQKRNELFEYDNVYGHGWGYKYVDGKRTDEVCILVYVTEKVSEEELDDDQVIPSEFYGYKTDVKATGGAPKPPEYDYADEDPGPMGDRGQYLRPVVGGIECFSEDTNNFGSIGSGVMYDEDGDRVILTNRHVVCDGDNECTGAEIEQGGERIGEVKELGQYLGDGDVSGDDVSTNLDAATVKLDDDVDAEPAIFAMGEMGESFDADVGDLLVHNGRTTGCKSAFVTAVDVSTTNDDGWDTISFDGCFEVDTHVEGGDSGSLMGHMIDGVFHPVGLVMSTDYEDYTWCHPISDVEDTFGEFTLPEYSGDESLPIGPLYDIATNVWVESFVSSVRSVSGGFDADVFFALTGNTREDRHFKRINIDANVNGESFEYEFEPDITFGQGASFTIEHSTGSGDIEVLVDPDGELIQGTDRDTKVTRDINEVDTLNTYIDVLPSGTTPLNGIKTAESLSDIPPGNSVRFVESIGHVVFTAEDGSKQILVPSQDEVLTHTDPQMDGDLNLDRNQLKNTTLEVLTEDPSDPQEGQLFILDET